MRKLDLGQSIGVLANVGVISGILFLGYEMRQNTSAIQTATLQGLMDLSTNYLLDTSLDPEFVRLLEKTMTQEPEQLEPIELRQVQRIIRSQLFRYQSAFLHERRGALGRADWETYENFMCDNSGVFGDTYQAYFWPVERVKLSSEFVAFLEGCNSLFQATELLE